MRSDYGDSNQNTAYPFMLHILGRNIPVVIFLVVAFVGMVAVYLYFSPADASAEVIALGNSMDSLSAPLYKPVPDRQVLQRVAQSPGPILIGVISGHKGFGGGSLCADGLSEVQVNQNIAEKVVNRLQTDGIKAVLLDEFDSRFGAFAGTAVVSIHSDSCDYINDLATGYKIAPSSYTDSLALEACLEQAYGAATGMRYHANTITPEMTDYHAFRELPPGVPSAIIEVGFMNLDREMLTTNADRPVTGVVNGIECYLDSVIGER